MKIHDRLEIMEENGSIMLDVKNFPYLEEDKDIVGVVQFSITPIDNKKANTWVLVPYRGGDLDEFTSSLKSRIDVELKKFEFEELSVFDRQKLVASLPSEVTGSFRAHVTREFQPFNPGDGPTTVERVM